MKEILKDIIIVILIMVAVYGLIFLVNWISEIVPMKVVVVIIIVLGSISTLCLIKK